MGSDARGLCNVVKKNADNNKFGYSSGAFHRSGKTCSDINMSQLARGIRIEGKGSDDEVWATKKALDRLVKKPEYYQNKELPPKDSATHKVVGKAIGTKVPMGEKMYEKSRKSGSVWTLAGLIDKIEGN